MSQTHPAAYVRVNRDALRHNCAQVVRLLDGRARLCAVVKANGYGHGLVEAGRLFVELGCDALGVAQVGEGLCLRAAGVTGPIHVFHPATREELPEAIRCDLTLTVTQPEHVAMLAAALVDADARCRYEIAVDAGLGRSGYGGDPAAFCAEAQERLGFAPSGVWTHLGPGMTPYELPSSTQGWANADCAEERLRCLEQLRDSLPAADRPLFHVAASTTVCDSDRLLWDMVRVGTLLYGQHPSHALRRPLELRRTLELRARIVELRTVPPGTAVGYGGEFRTSRETRLATVPVGLHQGVGLVPESMVSVAGGVKRAVVRRSGSLGRAFRPALATIGTATAPLVGRVSLNECTIDVTDVPGAELGSEVGVPARMTTLNPALPRVWADGDE